MDKIDDADCDGLDLSCWKVAFNGAEPVRAQTMDRFVKKFERFGFRPEAIFPCYGMAETTLFVAGRHGLKTQSLPCWDSFPVSNSSDVSQWSKLKPIVSCGKIADNFDLLIVDPETHQRLENDQVGEIWLRGTSVSSGYWKPPIAEQSFQNQPASSKHPAHRDWLRTGDLGFVSDGELYVTGRSKDLIIIRGRNIYPQDIEEIAVKVLGGHILMAAAFAIDDGASEQSRSCVKQSVSWSGKLKNAIKDGSSYSSNTCVIFKCRLRASLASSLGRLPFYRSVSFPKQVVEKFSDARVERFSSIGTANFCRYQV